MEPIKGSNKFEHFFYVLDKSHEPFSCGVQNDDQYHEHILKYTNISHYPFSKDTLRRVNIFLSYFSNIACFNLCVLDFSHSSFAFNNLFTSHQGHFSSCYFFLKLNNAWKGGGKQR